MTMDDVYALGFSIMWALVAFFVTKYLMRHRKPVLWEPSRCPTQDQLLNLDPQYVQDQLDG